MIRPAACQCMCVYVCAAPCPCRARQVLHAPLDFSCTVLVLGLSGTGKTATIHSLLGREAPAGYHETKRVGGCSLGFVLAAGARQGGGWRDSEAGRRLGGRHSAACCRPPPPPRSEQGCCGCPCILRPESSGRGAGLASERASKQSWNPEHLASQSWPPAPNPASCATLPPTNQLLPASLSLPLSLPPTRPGGDHSGRGGRHPGDVHRHPGPGAQRRRHC